MAAIAELVTVLHSNLDSIHKCIESLSSNSHEAEMECLERKREENLDGLRREQEAIAAEVEKRRKAEEQELKDRVRREEKAIAAKRRREDEERQARLAEQERERQESKQAEDKQRVKEAEEKTRMVLEQVEKELERLEDEMMHRVQEGRKMLLGLDEQRKAVNAKIEAAINIPTVIPPIRFRSRAKTSIMSGIVANTFGEAASNDPPRHTEASLGSGKIGVGQTIASSDVPLAPRNATGLAKISTLMHDESKVAQIVPLVLKTFAIADEAKTIPNTDIKSRDRSASVGKAWWDTKQLASMTEPQSDQAQALHGGVPIVKTPAGDMQMNQLNKVDQEALHSWVVAGNVVSKPIAAEDSGDVKARKEIARLNAELFNNGSDMQQRGGTEQDALPTSRALQAPRFAPFFKPLDLGKTTLRTFHFLESTRPAPTFNDSDSPEPIFRYPESRRPSPSFLYRFAESQRPKPQFSDTPIIYNIYRLLESQRSVPRASVAEKIMKTNILARGMYHWTEGQRPAPHFDHNSEATKVFQFKEPQRPSPSFLYRFKEGDRPEPQLSKDPEVYKTYRFLEGRRAPPEASTMSKNTASSPFASAIHHWSEGRRPALLFDKSDFTRVFDFERYQRPSPSFPYMSKKKKRLRPFLSGTHHWREARRPTPHFTDQAEFPRVFHFQESGRPVPNTFHVEQRPLPSISTEQVAYKIYHFLDAARPSPRQSDMERSRSAGNDPRVSKNVPGLFRFREQDRPLPQFASSPEAWNTFRYSEHHRPQPDLTFRFFEPFRQSPQFDESPRTYKTYHWTEEGRPIPFQDSDQTRATIGSSSVHSKTIFSERMQRWVSGVHHFVEADRPVPSFTDEQSVPPRTFRFGEARRPYPSFVDRVFESGPSAPTSDITAIDARIYHYLEAQRPITKHEIFSSSQATSGIEVKSDSREPRIQGSFLSSFMKNSSESHHTIVTALSECPNVPNVPENDHAAPEIPQRKSRVFASLVDVFKSDVPLMKRLRSHTYNSVPEEDYDPFSDEAYEHDIGHDMDPHRNRQFTKGMHSVLPLTGLVPDSDEEFPIYSSNGHRARTDTIGTVPSFEGHGHSDDEQSPATPSDAASSPFLEASKSGSWSPPREEIQHHETQLGMKILASPLRADFEPTYPQYIAPNAHDINLQHGESFVTTSSSASTNEDDRSETLSHRDTQGLFNSQTEETKRLQESTMYTCTARPSLSKIPTRPKISDRRSMTFTPSESPVASTPPPQTLTFQKRRSLFEVAAQPLTAPTQPRDDLLIPKSLDKNNKPPSPAFPIPLIRQSQGKCLSGPPVPTKNAFLSGFQKLVAAGSGGLEGSTHDPARFEKERLLTDRYEGY